MKRGLKLSPGPFARLPDEASIVIIGGGIMGLATSYFAARLGAKNVVVLERGYLGVGASGRNGGGIRMQWSTAKDIELMQESVAMCRQFAGETGVNCWFRQGGYLFLVKRSSLVSSLEKNVQLQNECGVPTRLLSPSEVQEVVPVLSTSDILVASYNPRDGVLFPWPFLWGYAARAVDLGAKIHTFCEVLEIEKSRERITRVRTNLGDIRCDHVVNAAGAWSKDVARLAGVTLPNWPCRHEILTTEPLKPLFDPMIAVLGEGIYFSQTMRGEIVGGMGDPNETPSFSASSSSAFLQRFARSATSLVPPLAHVQVVRQWAGSYDVSPDGRPILGESETCPNMTHLCGFTGHGFMMAPVIGKRCAERLVKGARVDYFDAHPVDRFRHGIRPNEETMIIG